MRTITGYKSPFTSHYVPLRIKKRRSSIRPSKRHTDGRPRQFKGIAWKMCTRRARCSYLRIDVSLNTLFIFVRYIPRRWNPPRGEARSTGSHERAPAVMIYRGTLRRARVRACERGWTRTRERSGGYCACRARQSTRRGLSPPDSVLITFFFFLSFVRRRERN